MKSVINMERTDGHRDLRSSILEMVIIRAQSRFEKLKLYGSRVGFRINGLTIREALKFLLVRIIS